MPYITKSKREYLQNMGADPEQLANLFSYEEIGDLNFFISKLIKVLFNRKPSYKAANNIIGVLECIKQEFYRTSVAPYEELKIIENGNI